MQKDRAAVEPERLGQWPLLCVTPRPVLGVRSSVLFAIRSIHGGLDRVPHRHLGQSFRRLGLTNRTGPCCWGEVSRRTRQAE